MKKLWSIIGILSAMLISYFLLKEFMIYYADRPMGASAAPTAQQVEESERVLKFIGTTHASLNDFLNFGKSEQYTEGDWGILRQWFEQHEPDLQGMGKKVKDPKIKRDMDQSYQLLKLGIATSKMEYVVYGHRIYHDLDILVNDFKGETNVWGFTEFGNGKQVQQVKDILQQNKQ